MQRDLARDVIGSILTGIGVTGIIVAIAFVTWLVISTIAQAHVRDRPDLDGWFQSLHNSVGGKCCTDNSKEARIIEDPDYEAQPDGSYIVHLDGKTIHVAPWQVVPGANKYGMALAWPKSDGKEVYCFIPGSGM